MKKYIRGLLIFLISAVPLAEPAGCEGVSLPGYIPEVLFEISLPTGTEPGPASLREHAVVWHPLKRKYYLIADVIPLDHPYHPNTYETELHLWSSSDLRTWSYHGVAVPRGEEVISYDAHGVASPAGTVYYRGRVYVPFSARRTAEFTGRAIGLAWSGEDPEKIPWEKTARPISELPGEDDDPALLRIPGDAGIHLYHRSTDRGYRIVHSYSEDPEDPDSWERATAVTVRPEGVNAQELTGAVWFGNRVHLFVIEQGPAVHGIRIAHLCSELPEKNFTPCNPRRRYLNGQPANLAFGGHITPILRGEAVVAFSWTVRQQGPRYGIVGHRAEPILGEEHRRKD